MEPIKPKPHEIADYIRREAKYKPLTAVEEELLDLGFKRKEIDDACRIAATKRPIDYRKYLSVGLFAVSLISFAMILPQTKNALGYFISGFTADNAAPQETRFRGHYGYTINIPENYAYKVINKKDPETIVFFPSDVSPYVSADKYAKYGIYRLNVIPRSKKKGGGNITLAVMKDNHARMAVKKNLKYRITDVALKFPAFKMEVRDPNYVEIVTEGKYNMFIITAGELNSDTKNFINSIQS